MGKLIGEDLLVKLECKNEIKNFHEEGSGCIVIADSREYDYVLTALHCLTGTDENSHDYEISDIKLYNITLNELEAVKTYENKELDIVVILVKKTSTIKSFMLKQKCSDGKVYVPSYPSVYRKENKHKTFRGKVASNKDNKLTIDIKDSIYERRNNVTDSLRGVSGAGIFQSENDDNYILGIVTNVPTANNPFCQIEGVDILEFVKVMEEHGLEKIIEYEIDVIKMLQREGKINDEILSMMSSFLEKEFKGDMYSRIEQGGQLTDEKINLENVFIDLYATSNGVLPKDRSEPKFINRSITLGNLPLKTDSEQKLNKFVIIGGAGQGKSTLSQFLSQIYRAYYLKEVDKCPTCEEVNKFINNYCNIEIYRPTCFRFPFRIILKDYAGWVAAQNKEKKSSSILSYFKYRLELKGEGIIEIDTIRSIMQKIPFLFVFDGLDEVPITSNRVEVIEEINNFVDTDLRRENCDALIIATTRPQGYTKEFDSLKYEHVHITDLDKIDCMKYLNRLIENIENSEEKRTEHLKILESALEDDVIARLMKTTLQATFLAILVRSGGQPPRNRYNLFKEYYNIISKRERQKGIIKILNDQPDYIEEIHYKLGFNLQVLSEGEENPSATVDIKYFRKFVQEYLSKDIGLEEDEVEKCTDEILEAITYRLVFISEIEDGKIGFSIRSMQEYFAANYYLLNEGPEVIPSKLNQISYSAYWRNTFLFLIGHIRKDKSYLINTIDSICGELNGSTDNIGENSGKKISKVGSWLALDILNEGIFSGRRNDENRFSIYLEELFLIAPNEDHSIFGTLSDDIKNRTVLKLVKKYISKEKFEEQWTAWVISANMLKHDYKKAIEIMDSHWPNGENEVLLIKELYIIGLWQNEWYINKFINAITKNDNFEFLNQFYNPNFIKCIHNHIILDSRIKKTVVENLLIVGFRLRKNTELWNILQSILDEDIFIKEEEKNYGIFELLNINKIKLFEGYFIHLRGITNINLEHVEILNRICEYYSIDSIGALLKFMLNPCVDSIKKLLLNLKEESEKVYLVIAKVACDTNWVIQKLFKIYPSKSSIDNAILFLEEGKLGDFEEWIAFEKTIDSECNFNDKILEEIAAAEYKEIESVQQNNVFGNYSKMNESLIMNNKSVVLNKHYYRDILEILLTLCLEYQEGNTGVVEIFDKQEMLNKIIEACCYYMESDLFYLEEVWIFTLYHINNKKLIELVTKQNLDYERKYLVAESFLFFITKDMVCKVFEKVLMAILTTEMETPLIQILPHCALTNFSDINKIFNKQSNIKYLHEIRYKNITNEMARVLLCLFDINMNREKEDRIIEAICEIYKQQINIFKYIVLMFEKCRIKGQWVEEFLVRVYNLIKNNDNIEHNILSRYET